MPLEDTPAPAASLKQQSSKDVEQLAIELTFADWTQDTSEVCECTPRMVEESKQKLCRSEAMNPCNSVVIYSHEKDCFGTLRPYFCGCGSDCRRQIVNS